MKGESIKVIFNVGNFNYQRTIKIKDSVDKSNYLNNIFASWSNIKDQIGYDLQDCVLRLNK